MRNNKLRMRLLCAFLSVLMLVCAVPATTVFAADSTEGGAGTGTGSEENHGGSGKITTEELFDRRYSSAEDRLKHMTKYYDDGEYSLYCDIDLGVIAYRKNATGEFLFTNPWDLTKETSKVASVRENLMAQITLTYLNGQGNSKTLNSYADAVLKGQMSVSPIKNGVRVEYAMGETSARILLPMRIEREAFVTKILEPLEANVPKDKQSQHELSQFKAYFDLKKYETQENPAMKEAVGKAFPVCKEKNIDIYVYNSTPSVKEMRKLEAMILAYCPNYSFEEMDNDYEFVDYEEEATSPPVFRMALEYTITPNGLSVCLPANGLRYDETAYRITDLSVLPFMGATYKGGANTAESTTTYSGYSFIPDGSGTLYALDTPVTTTGRVYGEDYSLLNKISGIHNETIRMPVFGQVGIQTSAGGKDTKSGYLAIIEEGESLASIAPSHGTMKYSTIIPSFITRQSDASKSGWEVYAYRRYTEDYRLRYIILSDDTKAQQAGLSSYYECSWMGMACAYRDYLDASSETFGRLTSEEVGNSIPLYIETFGCMDTIEKVMSIPVTVSVALTSFEDIKTMYDYLAGEGVSNVNFKLTGYANGGLYSDVPYKLKWEKVVGGKSGFKELLKQAESLGFGVYPDFDFVYTTHSDGGSKVNMKKHAARTIDNRYTSKRVYSATQQALVSYFQMVMSPALYSRFYEKLEAKYGKYGATGISLSTFGSALNSDYDEEKTTLREEAKGYTIEALRYFKNKNYDVMLEGGNAFTWAYADHILGIPLDSSRYTDELNSVPFMGVVLHGYVQFSGSAMNMEGNLKYAMLKAMESGASAYFVLSYANTELLKEDELLSQNYSVRYDIWQKRLVEIYHELNAVLADLQDKIITDHEFLNATRVPDKDELMQDIQTEAENLANQIASKLNRVSKAKVDLDQSMTKIKYFTEVLNVQFEALNAQRFAVAGADGELITAWKAAIAAAAEAEALTGDQVMALTNLFATHVADPFARLNQAMDEVNNALTTAKQAYIALAANSTNVDEVAAGREKLLEIVKLYLSFAKKYDGSSAEWNVTDQQIDTFIDDSSMNTKTSFTNYLAQEGAYVLEEKTVDEADLEAFVFGDKLYAEAGAKTIFDGYVSFLAKNLNANANVINLKGLKDAIYASLKVKVDAATPSVGNTTIGSDNSAKYSVDNSVVLVTYGKDMKTDYKSLLLNFNDYTIQVEVDGVLYTVGAYEYVVIPHDN